MKERIEALKAEREMIKTRVNERQQTAQQLSKENDLDFTRLVEIQGALKELEPLQEGKKEQPKK
jgi:hypothetical protein